MVTHAFRSGTSSRSGRGHPVFGIYRWAFEPAADLKRGSRRPCLTPHAHALEHPDHDRHRQPEDGDLDLHRVGVPVLRLADLDLPGVQGEEPGRPAAAPASQCMLHGKLQACEPIFEIPLVTFGTAVLLFSSFFVVMALNGAQTRQPEEAHRLAVGHGGVRALLRRDAGLRVQPLRPQGAGLQHQPLRLHLLHPDRLPRQPRDRSA